ncbi:saccharopine dehydrogenase NADP-binding domain-containing protein [Rhodococcus sp. 14-2470-1a]|uniref:saccharopine dehydrogenase NADP-binding domain-containing protein n=1 Tax=Rhodococcus sp. 14-2470-1a TaxID=2023150 RepID=UPI001C52EF55|nr:saccharopine dehydrogenase NADP-binding domain-containing protein [Rhodococcus sp. 14-2470-1a]
MNLAKLSFTTLPIIWTGRHSRAMQSLPVAVYGAYGHTGRLLVKELNRRGHLPVLSGRDARRLKALVDEYPGSDMRPASLDAPAEMDRALTDVAAVVNCAGPFGDTPPASLLDASRRAGVHYLDVAGEALVAWRTFNDFRPSDGTLVIPAVGFFGALGDLLASVAYAGAPSPADEVSVAIALNGWTPTAGSDRAGVLRAGRRVVYVDGHLDVRAGTPEPFGKWQFPPPFGQREVTGEFPTADVVTIARHLPTQDINAYIHVQSPGEAASTQRFLAEVTVRWGKQQTRVWAAGRDIYGFSAALAGEAIDRLLRGESRATGLATVSEAFDAADFLRALPLDSLELG